MSFSAPNFLSNVKVLAKGSRGGILSGATLGGIHNGMYVAKRSNLICVLIIAQVLHHLTTNRSKQYLFGDIQSAQWISTFCE